MNVQFINSPKPTYDLHVTNSFVICCYGKVPNKFHQWMMKMFFGFRFELRKNQE